MIKIAREIFGDYSQVALGATTVVFSASVLIFIMLLLHLAGGSGGALSAYADMLTAVVTVFIAIANFGVLIVANDAKKKFYKEKVMEETKAVLKQLSQLEHLSVVMYQNYAIKLYILHYTEESTTPRRVHEERKYSKTCKNVKFTYSPKYSESESLDNFMSNFRESYSDLILNLSIVESFGNILGKEVDSIRSLLNEVTDLISDDYNAYKGIFNRVGTESGVIVLVDERLPVVLPVKQGEFQQIPHRVLKSVDFNFSEEDYKYKRYDESDLRMVLKCQAYYDEPDREFEILTRLTDFIKDNKVSHDRDTLVDYKAFKLKDSSTLNSRFEELKTRVSDVIVEF
ncbi:hypothetical protein L1285_16785 [Pseudoalteromonas sp. DL2-H2.2]|uniref:hypothetical protein n=1 Tax=Pseudoalteromonas sp. DL2-H2.2 TaxID=2908889 RepID=UPI001F2BD874|nr:hypothetical protein [Pseudoalteromonas sp. DL2-H2.2]MCF2909978.1 hypothetical protein [Pseudoalteromonas sp. DL2-H2.2]